MASPCLIWSFLLISCHALYQFRPVTKTELRPESYCSSWVGPLPAFQSRLAICQNADPGHCTQEGIIQAFRIQVWNVSPSCFANSRRCLFGWVYVPWRSDAMLNIEGSCLWKRFRTVLSLRNSLRNRFALFAHLSEHHFVPDLPSSGWKMEEGDLDLQTRRCSQSSVPWSCQQGLGVVRFQERCLDFIKGIV